MSALNTPPDRKTIELIARALAIEEAFVEKDWYGVQVIAAIASLAYTDYELIFSGGTALSKAHKLIQRFSEDIDFRIRPISHSPNKTALSALKHQLIGTLREAGFSIPEESIHARDGNRYFTFAVRYERQFPHSSLRPDILVEMKMDSPRLPTVLHPVSSFIAEYTRQTPEVAGIACLAYVENAADKLSAIAWRIPDRVRGAADDDPSVVRHLHDLAILKDAVLRDPAFASLVKAAMETDIKRSKDASFATLPVGEKFARLFAILASDKKYPDEYKQFVAGLSYAPSGTVPDFHAAVAAVRQLAATLS